MFPSALNTPLRIELSNGDNVQQDKRLVKRLVF